MYTMTLKPSHSVCINYIVRDIAFSVMFHVISRVRMSATTINKKIQLKT